ncbi:MAG: nitrile hydratase subunit beta [Betaproteobacteria bacterium]|nr:nitrile hydratase subunit beta [Betaproteobacteria bacterium]
MTPGRRTQERSPLPSTYTPAPGHRFKVGDRVVIKRSFPPGHRRTPYYIRGKRGVIERICGAFPNPEELAYGFDGEPRKVLYRVRFAQNHVWPEYRGPAHDVIEMEIFEHWLEPASGSANPASPDELG